MVAPLKLEVTLNENILFGLTKVLRQVNPLLVSNDDLVQVLGVIQKRSDELHKTGSENKQIALLSALSQLLGTMADIGLTGLSQAKQHEPLYDRFIELSKDKNLQVKRFALCAAQALVRIPDDESGFESIIRHLKKIHKGISNFKSSHQIYLSSKIGRIFSEFFRRS